MTCYHCHATPARSGSMFCERCAPMPRVLAEQPRPRLQSFLPRLIDALLRPRRIAALLRIRLEAERGARLDCERANLALRKKCADLKAQLRAAQASVEQLEGALRMRN